MNEILEVFGVDWKLLIVQTVNFVVLVIGLSYFLYRPTIALLKKRADVVAQGLKDAEDAGKRKTEIEGEREGIVTLAQRDATEIVSRAQDEAKREKADIMKSAQERSDSLLADARKQADELERQALMKSDKEIARAAVLAAEKILRGQS